MQLLHDPARANVARVTGQLLLLGLLFACAPTQRQSREPTDAEPDPVGAMLDSKPFGSVSERVPAATHTRELLEVPGFGSAVISLPSEADRRAPVLMVLHGAGDRPEWQCEWWEAALGNRVLIACLRGKAAYPRDPETGFYFPHHHYLDKLVVAASRALRQKYAARIAGDRFVMAGFSQGAIMGALVAANHPELFSRLMLIEGGYEEWNVAAGLRLNRSGEARVVFACGQNYCARHALLSQRWLKRAGVESRVELAPGAGHTYADEVGERVLGSLPWLVEGAAGWE
jgi:predicted esterase